LKNRLRIFFHNIYRSSNIQVESYQFNGSFIVMGRGRVVFEKGVRINSSRKSNPIGGDDKTTFFVSENAKIHVGMNSGISNSTLYAATKITIGNDVKIGGSSKIYDTDFHSLDSALRKDSKTDVANCLPVNIEDDVFIGAHTIILKGVNIGAKSIVAAGSVVVKSIPSGEVWGGNPAKFIREAD